MAPGRYEWRPPTGHIGRITCLAFAPNDPNRLLSGGTDGLLIEWNPKTDEKVREIDPASEGKPPEEQFAARVSSCVYLTDGRIVAVGYDGYLIVAKPAGKLDIRQVPSPTKDGRRFDFQSIAAKGPSKVLIGTRLGGILELDVDAPGKQAPTVLRSETPDGKNVFTVGSLGDAGLFFAGESGAFIRRGDVERRLGDKPSSGAALSNGIFHVLTWPEQTVARYRTDSSHVKNDVALTHPGSSAIIAANPTDGSFAVGYRVLPRVEIFDKDDTLRCSLDMPAGVEALSFDSVGARLAVGTDHGGVVVVDAAASKKGSTCAKNAHQLEAANIGRVTAVAGGNSQFAVGDSRGQVSVFQRIDEPGPAKLTKKYTRASHSGGVNAVAMTPLTGSSGLPLVVSGGEDLRVMLNPEGSRTTPNTNEIATNVLAMPRLLQSALHRGEPAAWMAPPGKQYGGLGLLSLERGSGLPSLTLGGNARIDAIDAKASGGGVLTDVIAYGASSAGWIEQAIGGKHAGHWPWTSGIRALAYARDGSPPDQSRLFVVGGDGGLSLLALAKSDGAPRPIGQPKAGYQHVVTTKQREAWVWAAGGTKIDGFRFEEPNPSKEGGQAANTTIATPSAVTALATTLEGDWLIAGLADGRIHVYDVPSGVHLSTLIVQADGNWASLDADGWLVAGQGPIDYLEPKTQANPLAAPAPTLAPMQLPSPPQVDLLEDGSSLVRFEVSSELGKPTVVLDDAWEVQSVRDLGNKLYDVRLLIEDVPPFVAPAIPDGCTALPSRATGPRHYMRFRFTDAEKHATEERCWAFSLEAGLKATQGKRKALVIGLKDYKKLAPLPGAEADAENIYNALTSSESWGKNDVARLNDPRTEGTGSALRKRLSRFFTSPDVEGKVLFLYLAGHGLNRGDDAFFLPLDHDPSKPDRDLSAKSLWTDYIGESLNHNPDRIVVVIDSCHAGRFVLPREVRAAVLDKRVVIVTSTSDEKRAAAAKTGSDFTDGFADAIRGQRRIGTDGGAVTVYEAFLAGATKAVAQQPLVFGGGAALGVHLSEPAPPKQPSVEVPVTPAASGLPLVTANVDFIEWRTASGTATVEKKGSSNAQSRDEKEAEKQQCRLSIKGQFSGTWSKVVLTIRSTENTTQELCSRFTGGACEKAASIPSVAADASTTINFPFRSLPQGEYVGLVWGCAANQKPADCREFGHRYEIRFKVPKECAP